MNNLNKKTPDKGEESPAPCRMRLYNSIHNNISEVKKRWDMRIYRPSDYVRSECLKDRIKKGVNNMIDVKIRMDEIQSDRLNEYLYKKNISLTLEEYVNDVFMDEYKEIVDEMEMDERCHYEDDSHIINVNDVL